MKISRELADERTKPLGALGLFHCPRKLAPEAGLQRSLVRLVDVGKRQRLTAVPLSNDLVVRQIDPDGSDGSRVAGLDHDIDRVRAAARDPLLSICRVPGHPVL